MTRLRRMNRFTVSAYIVITFHKQSYIFSCVFIYHNNKNYVRYVVSTSNFVYFKLVLFILNKQLGYVEMDQSITIQICPGEPSALDMCKLSLS